MLSSTAKPAQSAKEAIRPPTRLRERFAFLSGHRASIQRQRDEVAKNLEATADYLSRAAAVEEALEKLSQQLFGGIVKLIESQLSAALREVLDQKLTLKVDREFKYGSATMSFHIEREGQREDILRGQGGSVQNILSVGLRIFALTTLDQKQHRRFLVLDEQDCWLHPSLVPRLVSIIHQAARSLGFQVLMISHHDVGLFDRFADKIYRLEPGEDGVVAKVLLEAPPRDHEM
jgi:hypothetical protein